MCKVLTEDHLSVKCCDGYSGPILLMLNHLKWPEHNFYQAMNCFIQ